MPSDTPMANSATPTAPDVGPIAGKTRRRGENRRWQPAPRPAAAMPPTQAAAGLRGSESGQHTVIAPRLPQIPAQAAAAGRKPMHRRQFRQQHQTSSVFALQQLHQLHLGRSQLAGARLAVTSLTPSEITPRRMARALRCICCNVSGVVDPVRASNFHCTRKSLCSAACAPTMLRPALPPPTPAAAESPRINRRNGGPLPLSTGLPAAPADFGVTGGRICPAAAAADQGNRGGDLGGAWCFSDCGLERQAYAFVACRQAPPMPAPALSGRWRGRIQPALRAFVRQPEFARRGIFDRQPPAHWPGPRFLPGVWRG